ncbi:hypothetical protein [Sphingopyxis sp.]|uniref:hypothetical protein n=1 Tax=Sphingopyxis sp. TaxID=1908224 RepID=UPI0025F8DF06|nr:hypothetical protein [Sphingopyxis sp.]
MFGELPGIEPDPDREALDHLIQLPVAFWAGTTAKADPVPPEKPTTVPRYSTSLP